MFHPPAHPYTLPEEPHSESAQPRTLAEPSRGALASLRAWVRAGHWRVPLLLYVLTLIVYGALSFDRLTKPSADTHFVYLANTYNSMIAARMGDADAIARRADKVPFELDKRPPHRNDWASYWDLTLRDGERVQGIWLDRHGSGRIERLDDTIMILEPSAIDRAQTTQRFFVSFPPAPAVMMMPLAAVWDYRVNDVLWTLAFAAANVALVYILLARLARGGRTGRGRRENLWLTALFALSTAHIWCGILGQVWFTALIMGVTFTLVYMLCAIDAKHPLLAGIACALAFSTRTPLLFTSVFFFLFVLFPHGALIKRAQWGWAIKKIALFSAPCLIVGGWLMWMNHARFGSMTEFGHVYLAAGQLGRIKQYGLFHWHFLSMNLSAMFALLPGFSTVSPHVTISKHGLSLLFTTPALLWLCWPKARASREDRFWYRVLWATVAACALPGLFYQNTGYEQFGYRFSLDYTAYLIALLAVGRQPISAAFKACVLFGVGVNLFGAVTFKRFVRYYSEQFFV